MKDQVEDEVIRFWLSTLSSQKIPEEHDRKEDSRPQGKRGYPNCLVLRGGRVLRRRHFCIELSLRGQRWKH
jgi:hypothetical protein